MSPLEKEIPNIKFDHGQDLPIEVMSFEQLADKLDPLKDHNPYEVHRVEFYLILVLTKHNYSHFVDFRFYEMKQGSALFIAKNQVHHFTKTLKNAEGVGIIFSGPFADKHQFLSGNLKLNRLFNYHIESPIIHPSEFSSDSLIEIANSMYEEYSSERQFAKTELLHSLLQILLLKAERAKEFKAIESVKPQWLETFSLFKDRLELNYCKSRNSKKYASDLFISYKFLNDVVKKISGRTAKSFIDDFVTIEIKRLLVSTNLSVKEISYKTGFDDPANMVKFFKKHANCTPFKFRQQQ